MSTPSFEPTGETTIPTLGVTLQHFRHRSTGARHFHLAADDQNNAFMVAFPTLPNDSTGVAHILEHTTLCGSQRFPVRDPFFMMLRRSLNTYMNAFTSGDTTAYPFATQNRKDFENLLSVYLDAVFFPRLHELDFAQEGWRVEATDDGAGLEFHGVVFNEMKGAMSSPVARLWQHVHTAIFPETVYRHNSGGEPLAIPDLNYQALRDFHSRYYQPSNAVFMTYGSFPVAEHQQQFESLALARFENEGAHYMAPTQTRRSQPNELVCQYPSESDSDSATHIVWAWLLNDAVEVRQSIEAHFLSSLLLEHSASPLRQFLETTELAQAPSELCGIDDSARQLLFICGAEGSSPDAAAALEQTMFEVLERVARDGVSIEVLEAIVDRLELAQRDIGSGGYPYGLQVMGRLLPAAVYGGDPVAALNIDTVLTDLRQSIRDPEFVPGLIRRCLLENNHRVRITMVPDDQFAARERADEKQLLADLSESIGLAGIADVKARAAALRERQNQVDDENILPKVTLADVPAATPLVQPWQEKSGSVSCDLYDCAANGVFRFKAAYPLPLLTPEEIRELPLFCEYLTELGHGTEAYLDVQRRRALCGDFSAYALVRPNLGAAADDPSGVHAYLVVTAKGLNRKRRELIENVHEIVHGTRFDESERLRDLLLQSRAEAEQSVSDRGHALAIANAGRALTPTARLEDLWNGPRSVHRLIEDAADDCIQARVELLSTAFASIQQKTTARNPRLALIGDSEALSSGGGDCISFAVKEGQADAAFTINIPDPGHADVWVSEAQVNFCARAFTGPAFAHPDAAALTVLGRYLQDGYLHREIREQGGAYGSGAAYDADSATFRMFSYRDPCDTETFSAFDGALEWCRENYDPQRLEESMLGVIRSLDQPSSPTGEAERSFLASLCGRDDSTRAAFRAGVLGVTYEHLVRVVTTYLDNTRRRDAAIACKESEAAFTEFGLATEHL
ncbi:MAG: insulinase family protein [Gammaproteobacteria bacterium]